jgi:GT2 family glycosyltransferase
VEAADDLRLFWSLSFAVTCADWGRIGGFDEGYLGYGGEDTDFGQRLGAAGGRMLWIGGAQAYHQHHATSSPPVDHLKEIVDNANLFARRWGWWPMEGWLADFEKAGLARRLEDGSWVATPPDQAGG